MSCVKDPRRPLTPAYPCIRKLDKRWQQFELSPVIHSFMEMGIVILHERSVGVDFGKAYSDVMVELALYECGR